MGVLDTVIDKMKISTDYDDDDCEYEEEEEEGPQRVRKSPSRDIEVRQKKALPQRTKRNSGASSEICVIKPQSIDDGRDITNTLLNNRSVLLNLEGLDLDIAQRIIDFTSGSCFAMHGNMQKISNSIFVITPPSVDISGDFQDILGATGSLDLPHIQSEL